jgi:metal-dependent amidase/aminoacylase/carboxypeptidase family protein
MAFSLNALKLRLLLRMMAILLARATKRSARLREMLAEDNFVFQLATEGGSGGCFVLSDGVLRYRAGLHTKPDFAQVWKTPGEAVRVMTSPDESDLMRAYNAGHCRMEGHFGVALWFNEAMKIALPKKGKKS